MKKERKIFIVLCSVLIMLSGCSKNNKDDNDDFNNFFTQYVSDYTVVQENDDGTVEISVIAPDYKAIMEKASENNNEHEISMENINNLVNEYPDYKKEYIFTVKDLSNESIEEALNDKIVEDLIKSAIKNTEYEEKWSTEE